MEELCDKFCEKIYCKFDDNTIVDGGTHKKIQNLWYCEWLPSLSSPIIQKFIENDWSLSFCEETCDDFNLFTSAIASLLSFIRENFAGPSLEEEYGSWIDSLPKNVKRLDGLCVDNEELNINVKYPELLLIAKNSFDYLLQKNRTAVALLLWKLRVLRVHQNVLDDLTQSIYAEFINVANELATSIHKLPNLELKSLVFIEISLGYLTFHRVQKCEEYLELACELLDIKCDVEGILGVRTKFQQKPLPQLCLKVQQSSEKQLPNSSETNTSITLPKLLAHEDDVLLEKIQFISVDENITGALPSTLQSVILAKLNLLLRLQPKSKLADEELEPYIRTLLYQDHGPLAIRLSALLINVQQEKNKKRTVERSLKQCEEILKIIDNKTYSVFERFSYIFTSNFWPRWDIKKLFADVMVSLGLIKTALDLYLEIQEWESVVDCYIRLDLKHKAAEIIQEEITKKPSVKLYCLLGETTDDVSYFEMAWKISKESSSRAQRHWGCYYFRKKEYEKALPHLQKSLEINSLQEVTWLHLGYTAIMLEKWEVAVQAYLTYTHLEPHGFESWNNLAKALIKLGNKKRAHKILGEALKCNYNNWKVWENFMLVSVDTGNFEDVINAYNRLNELKEKFIDLEIIEIIVNAIEKNIPDAQGKSIDQLRKKMNKLLAHQCVQHASEPKLWEFAAILAENSLSKALKLQKFYITYTQRNNSWVNTKETCLKVMNICKALCESSLEAIEVNSETEKSNVYSQLSSARLTVQACIRTVENYPNKWSDLQYILEDLKTYLRKITNVLQNGIQ